MRVYIGGWVSRLAAVVRIHLVMLIAFRLNVITAILVDVRAIKGQIRWPRVLLELGALYPWPVSEGQPGTIVQYIIHKGFFAGRKVASGYAEQK